MHWLFLRLEFLASTTTGEQVDDFGHCIRRIEKRKRMTKKISSNTEVMYTTKHQQNFCTAAAGWVLSTEKTVIKCSSLCTGFSSRLEFLASIITGGQMDDFRHCIRRIHKRKRG
ncbi:hypothetical protein CEXT_746341 [Caerostris extrusa]|uniref:Secreted protein n=1 Tax=Caerostris extrusa TaxID=172846 RepID=A0AAV4VDM7_CAEEX|nr:hypothetical protein CEXT_746341 [Caerostris extrusa]